MKKWIIILLALVILGIIGAGLAYKYIYNKPHKNYEIEIVDFSMSANDLFQQYRIHTIFAQQKYNGKVIKITGILSKIETSGDLTIGVFALDEGPFGDEGIRCTMLENHAEDLADYEGKNITIKGYCTGFNDTDVILEKCSIIK
ncbi:MAG: hypothetical protein R2750_13710 [Bacteroidales bacterium]